MKINSYTRTQQQLLKALNRHAAHYKNVACLAAEVGKNLLSRLTYFRVPPTSILDLGCGQGFDTLLLAEAYPNAQIVASDLCHKQFQYWPQSLRAKTQTIHPCVAEACALPFPDGYFDLLFVNLVMPTILDYHAFWRECIRVLKPGAVLLFSTLGSNTLKELKQSMVALHEEDCINVFPNLHDIGDSLVAAGFSDPAIECEVIELHYSHLKKLLDELKALGSIKLWASYPHVYKSQHFWQTLEQYYRTHFSSNQQKLIASAEIYYAIAFAPQQLSNQDESVSIPIANIKRRT